MANYMPDFVPMSRTVGRLGMDNLEYHLMARDAEYANSNSKGHSMARPPSTPSHLPPQYSQPPLNLNTLSSMNATGSTGSTNSATSSSSSTHGPSILSHPAQGQPSNSPNILLPPGQMGTQVIHIIHSARGNKSHRPSASDVEDVLDEHDYYNDDYARLQRELQPLTHRRNETTV